MANEEIEKMLDNSSEVLDALHAEFLNFIFSVYATKRWYCTIKSGK